MGWLSVDVITSRLRSLCTGSGIRLKYYLGNHYFPLIAAKAFLVLRVRTFSVPGCDGQDRGKRATHTVGGLETIGKLPYHCSFAIQKLPTRRPDSHVQPISWR